MFPEKTTSLIERSAERIALCPLGGRASALPLPRRPNWRGGGFSAPAGRRAADMQHRHSHHRGQRMGFRAVPVDNRSGIARGWDAFRRFLYRMYKPSTTTGCGRAWTEMVERTLNAILHCLAATDA